MRNRPKGPLFIMGCPRSGTTMLVKMLSAHDAIHIMIGESHFYSSVYANRALFGNIGTPKSHQMLREYLTARKKRKLEWQELTFEDWLSNFDKMQGKNYLDLYFALMLTFAQTQHSLKGDSFYIGDKDPTYIYHITHLLRYFPEARVIHIVRDGRAVVSSMLNCSVGPDKAIDAALLWKRHMQLTRKFERSIHKDAYLRVSYEKLVTDSENRVKTICKFLDVPYQKAMLDSNLAGLSSFAHTNDSRIDNSRINYYTKILSEEQIQLIEYAGDHELKDYGYLPRTASVSASSVSSKVKTTLLIRYWCLRIKELLTIGSNFLGIRKSCHQIVCEIRNLVRLFNRRGD